MVRVKDGDRMKWILQAQQRDEAVDASTDDDNDDHQEPASRPQQLTDEHGMMSYKEACFTI